MTWRIRLKGSAIFVCALGGGTRHQRFAMEWPSEAAATAWALRFFDHPYVVEENI